MLKTCKTYSLFPFVYKIFLLIFLLQKLQGDLIRFQPNFIIKCNAYPKESIALFCPFSKIYQILAQFRQNCKAFLPLSLLSDLFFLKFKPYFEKNANLTPWDFFQI